MALRGPRGLLAGLAACLAAPRTPAAPAGGSAALLVVGEVTGPLRQPGQDADALKVEFSMRKQIWGDHDGSLYYSSHAGHRLYKMDAAGSLRTVAGNGQPGWWGDGGLANQAGVRYPGPVWGDRSGHVFFVDNASSCLRRIDTQGIIATVAAFSWPRPSIGALWGDRSGDLYVTDTERRQVLRLRAEGDGYAEEVFAGRAPAATPAPLGHSGDGGPALHARLAQPNGLWGDDSGSLYVAEMAGHRIRRIDRAGRISTVAGTGSPGYSGDGGVATSARLKCPCDLWGDGYGSLFVADMGNHRIRRVDPQGNISTFAGNGSQGYAGDGGSARDASLSAPKGVWVDRHGAVFISDTFNQRIRRVDERGAISSFGHLGGSSPKSSRRWSEGLRLGRAPGLGHLLSDARGHALLRLAGASTSRLAAADARPGPGGAAAAPGGSVLNHPEGLCAGGGSLYVLDSGSSALGVVDVASGQARPLALRGSGGEGVALSRPVGCCWSGGRLLVTDQGSHRVLSVDVSSGEARAVAGSGEFGCDGGRLGCPYGVASGDEGSGLAFVTDPCCPDAFVRRLDLESGTTTVLAGHTGVTSTDRASAVFRGGFLWIPGIDDCGLEVLDCASGRMHEVQLLDRQGRNMPTDCIVDVVRRDDTGESAASSAQLDLLSISKAGDIEIVGVRAPAIVVTEPVSNGSWPSGVVSLSWRSDDGDLLGTGELSMVDVGGAVRVSLGSVPLASGVARVSLASLPSAVQGDLFIELASVRWPFVQGRAGPFHSGAGVAAPAPSLAGATSQGGALTAAAALVAGAALVLLLPFAFLRLRLKAYGKMGGAVVFQWRAGFGGPGAARAQQADEEMAPMACTGRAGHGEAPPTAVALGRASATCARPAGL